ncbi:hypothetical protein NUH30_18710 [Leptospira sp. 85282-16]|uniref:Uncharacterized protein n=4 Tax=root TaxID=1 RepID=Q6NDX6_9CAUD|nr:MULTISPECIES: hypothetical protein [Leptospira]YP_009860206.1 hypothetical protein HWD53_gp67 [Leptospira phage LE1]MCT8335724.1 hypothetical protein [Leptospira sp. 85282-16]TGL04964.1 hypothetical protein EHQ43_09985 [Leptospira bouyouniensis]TGN13503.1 hypothetical protein EHR08_11645 [Leptospira bandrabouensis]CAE14768.1 unnamed protein product [Leptospira phage LE1]GBF44387.1 hypothetical protein LPTSP2_36900 [Leptospira ellinghausenii]
MKGKYAENTEVSSDRSKSEIEKTLRKYGAKEFVSGWNDNQAMILFSMEGRKVKFLLPLPPKSDFSKTETGRARKPNQIEEAYEQGIRQRWRALSLAIKAKLEMLECGIATFDEEFLPYIVMPNGSTVAEEVIPKVKQAYLDGKQPQILIG